MSDDAAKRTVLLVTEPATENARVRRLLDLASGLRLGFGETLITADMVLPRARPSFDINALRQPLTLPPAPLRSPQVPLRLGRNAPCACGSGKKAKRCCGGTPR